MDPMNRLRTRSRRALPLAILVSAVIAVAGCSSGKTAVPDEGPGSSAELARLGLRFPLVTRRLSNGLKILLVEDHKPTSQALLNLLSRRRHRVTLAGSLAEARAAVEREEFDLLISDIGLPDGDGCELMNELRARPHFVGVALTGYGAEEDVSRSHDAGFIAHLTNPVSISALDVALSAACRLLDE